MNNSRSTTRSGWISFGARLVLGGVFLSLGWNKASDPVGFLKLIREYDVVRHSLGLNVVAVTLPWIEILAGALLVVGIGIRGNALLLLGLLVGFTCLIYGRARGIQTETAVAFCSIRFDCGCGNGEVPVCRKLIENLGLMALALVVLFGSRFRWALRARLTGRH